MEILFGMLFVWSLNRNGLLSVVKRLKMSRDHPGNPSSSSTSKVVSREDPQQPERSSKEGSTASSSRKKKKAYELSQCCYEYHMSLSSYVDKTLFIKALLDSNNMTLITAPRLFGKSANLEMLRKFVEIQTDDDGNPFELEVEGEGAEAELKEEQESPNFHLFADKKIFKHKHIFREHFGQYPVINVDFKSVRGNSYEHILQKLRSVLFWSFQEHKYLAKSKMLSDSSKAEFNKYYGGYKNLSEEEIAAGLKQLSYYLFQHFNRRVFVLIDELDAPINAIIRHASSENAGTLNEVAWARDCIECINKMICSLPKSDKWVAKALLTCCHHVKNILSQDVNIQHVAALRSDVFCHFYGFTAKEVKQLLVDRDLSQQFNEVQQWYNGYWKMLRNGESVEIYCNNSILYYLREKKTKCFWRSGAFARYEMLLIHDNILDKCRAILAGETVKIQSTELTVDSIFELNKVVHKYVIGKREVDLFLQFLYENGYLKLVEEIDDELTLEVPNQEIRKVFSNTIYTTKLVMKWCNVVEPAPQRFIRELEYVITNETESSRDALANCIKDMLVKGKLPHNEFELSAKLYYTLSTKLRDSIVHGDKRISPEGQCKYNIQAIIESKRFKAERIGVLLGFNFGVGTDSRAALKQILDESVYRVLEGKQIVHKLLIGVHMAQDGKITVTYLKKPTDKCDTTWDIGEQLTRESC